LETLQVKNALISVYYKDGLEPIVRHLQEQNIGIYSTGGTRDFIEKLGIPVLAVEDLTGYPSIFGGRVKTLHPAVFGGILHRRDLQEDLTQAAEFNIPSIDLVIVDLYPFEETLKSGAAEKEMIEKIDIGGVSLIRAAAKNFEHTCIVSDKNDYEVVLDLMVKGQLNRERRKHFAAKAFAQTQSYDNLISEYLFNIPTSPLRYGENPHQKAWFIGDLNKNFTQLQGKEISYNNLLDIEAAISLISDFDTKDGATFAIIKHNNACGISTNATVSESYDSALSSDPVSAFGGIMICNHPIELETAQKIDKIFFEILLAPGFEEGVLELFSKKSQRSLLKINSFETASIQKRTILQGELYQEKDNRIETSSDFKLVTKKQATAQEIKDLEFAVKLVKHTKSNAIVLVKNQQMISSGTGQTSRVDALNQAIEKAKAFGFDIQGAVMASDAFFPFPDCVEIGFGAGITAIAQPGGSIKDNLSIEKADELGIAMVLTGFRHFKH